MASGRHRRHHDRRCWSRTRNVELVGAADVTTPSASPRPNGRRWGVPAAWTPSLKNRDQDRVAGRAATRGRRVARPLGVVPLAAPAGAGHEQAGTARRGRCGGRSQRANLSSGSWPAASPSRSTGGPSRCPTTAPRCSRCCGTGSASARPRTAAARRASAGAARCWSTARPGSPASRRPAVSPAGRSPRVEGLDPAEQARVGRGLLRDRREPVRVLHAGDRRAPGRPRREQGPRPAGPRSTRRCWPTSAAAPVGRRSRRRSATPSAGSPHGASAGATCVAAARRADARGWHARSGSAPSVALGQGGFADDTAPADALVAVRAADGSWVVGETLVRGAGARPARCRAAARRWRSRGRSRCRRATGPGRCARRGWSPRYLEPDASWCAPGGEPASPLANGGAFGGKLASALPAVARRPGRPPRPAGAGAGQPGGRRAARAEAAAAGRRRPCRRHRRRAGRAHARHRGRDRLRRTRPAWSRRSTWPGRRRRPLCGARVGRRRPSCSPRSARRRRSWLRTVPRPRRTHRPRRPVARDGPRAATARRGRAALVLHRRGPHGARLGPVEGLAVDERRRSRVDLTIRSFGILRAVDMPPVEVDDRAGRRRAGQRLRRGLRRRGRRRLASPRPPARLAGRPCSLGNVAP